MTLKLSVRTVAYWLFGAIICLTFLHSILQAIAALSGQTTELFDRFDVNNEASIPTWFSQIELFVAAMLLGLIAWVKTQKGDSFFGYWTFLGFIFLYLSIDEGATLHEMLVAPIKGLFHTLPSFFYFAWVIPFGIIVAIIGVAYLKFLRHLPSRTRKMMIIAGALYVGGALGMEMIGGAILSSELPQSYYLLAITLEESMEMLGSGIFIISLLGYVRDSNLEVNVGVSS